MTVVTSPPQVPDLLGTAPADLIDRYSEAPVATRDVATRRAERIRAGVVAYAAMRQDIADAYAQRDWLALDYGSWHEYVQAEFGAELAKLARDDRREAVRDLRTQGLSIPQIASATGASTGTVHNDLKGFNSENLPKTITGSDGKSYPASRPSTPDTPNVPAGRDAAHNGSAPVSTPGRPGGTTAPPAPTPPADATSPAPAGGTPTAETDDEADARRDAQLDAELADTAVRFRRNFSAALAAATKLWSFDVDRIAEVYATDWDAAMGRGFIDEMRRWCDRVEAARRDRTRLRIVDGGRP